MGSGKHTFAAASEVGVVTGGTSETPAKGFPATAGAVREIPANGLLPAAGAAGASAAVPPAPGGTAAAVVLTGAAGPPPRRALKMRRCFKVPSSARLNSPAMTCSKPIWNQPPKKELLLGQSA